MDDALKVIKSLLTTSSSGGLLVNEITKEYKEIVGKPIPFKEHGFDTLTDFLRSTNEFNGTKTANGIKVTIKIPGKSAHIIAMRQKQNVSQAEKKRRKKSIMNSGIAGGGGGGGGGAISSQQSKRSLSSQVMKRNSGAILKHRPRARARAHPQRTASRNLMAKPVVPPPQRISASAETNNTSRPPVNTVTHHAEPLRKSNLHERFVQKQLSEPLLPVINSKPGATAVQPSPTPVTPPPIRFNCKSPQTPPYEEKSVRSKLMARLVQKQLPPSDNCSRKTSNDSDANTVSSDRTSLHSVGRPSRSQLLAQLSPSRVTTPIGRAALQKICQNIADQKKGRPSCNDIRLQMNQSNSTIQHEQKPCAAVPLGKTMSRNDLYARLAPKLTESTNETKPVGDNLVCTGIKSSINAVDNKTLNQAKKKTDISSRIQPKKIGAESSELQEISQKLSGMNIMEVDAAVNESRANPLNGIKKFDLSARLQSKQYEMDVDQFNWVRSVKTSDRQIKVTVNLN